MDHLVLAAAEGAGAQTGALGITLALVLMLAAAAAVAVVVRYVKVPYTVALVVAGLAFSFSPNLLAFEVDQELILAVLVTPLVFEGTIHMSWRRLRADLLPVLVIAIGGTLLGTIIVATIVQAAVPGIPLTAAIAFGALISATDPVAVIAFFRSLGVPKRLTVLVEGESLFNDGVSIVVFTLATMAAIGGEALTVGGALGQFLIVALGGLLIGSILGYIVSNLILKNLDDHLIETLVTVALAFGSFVLAEEFGLLIGRNDLHLSGILSVVAAGLMVGNLGFYNTSPTTRLTIENFWEFLAFVINSVVFLLIGFEINIIDIEGSVATAAFQVIIAVGAVLLARSIIVYGFPLILNRLPAVKRVEAPYQHVMFWGGLRGAVSLALALTLPAFFEDEVSSTLQLMTFGVVLFTLLVQGTTISGLIRRLGLADKSEAIVAQQRKQATMLAKKAGRDELSRLRHLGVIYPQLWNSLDDQYDIEIEDARRDLGEHFQTHPELETAMFLQARADALNAERSALVEAARRGIVSAEVSEEMVTNLNNRLAALVYIERGLSQHVELPIDLGNEPFGDGEDG